MTDRQLRAVAEAIFLEQLGGDENSWDSMHPDVHNKYLPLAKAAIEASDAKYVPMLVEALKEQASYLESIERMTLGATSLNLRLQQVLNQLPEEYMK